METGTSRLIRKATGIRTRLDWAEITRQIQSLCQRIKRFQRIQRDTPRLLNLLKTELRAKHAFKHPIKEQQKQRTRTYDLER